MDTYTTFATPSPSRPLCAGDAVGARRFGRDGCPDRGVTLPIVAIMIISVLAFAGFAVDLGVTFNARRQDQTAADAGALAGGVTIVDENASVFSTPGLFDSALNWVKWTTYQDISKVTPITQAEWNTAWETCTDAGAYGFTAPSAAATTSPSWPAGGATGCISFNDSASIMRVKVPEREVPATFTQLVGFDDFKTSAVAEVEFVLQFPAGGVLPFGIWQAASQYGEVCATSAAGNIPYALCQGGSSGNFGYVDFKIYGNPSVGNTSFCGNNQAAARITYNVVMGLDHPLGLVPNHQTGVMDAAWPEVREDLWCPIFLARPNTVDTETGNALIGATEKGLLEGTTAGQDDFGVGTQPGRLTNTCPYPFGSTTPAGTAGYCLKATGGGVAAQFPLYKSGIGAVDHVGLWQFLSPTMTVGTNAATQVPRSCHIASYFANWYVPNNPLNPQATKNTSYPWLRYKGDGFTAAPGTDYVQRYPNRSKEHIERCIHDYQYGYYDFAAYDTYRAANGGAVPAPDVPGGYRSILFGRDSDGDPSNGIYDIMRTPRFGYVPLFWETNPVQGGSNVYHIRTRRAIYIETMFFGCNNNACDTGINPGEFGSADPADRAWNAALGYEPSGQIVNGAYHFPSYTTAQSNKNLDAMTAVSFVIPDMLPEEARDPALTEVQDVGVFLRK